MNREKLIERAYLCCWAVVIGAVLWLVVRSML